MEESIGLYYEFGERPVCPCCVEAMINRREVTVSDAGDHKVLIGESGETCSRCFLPLARPACAEAFERVMNQLAEWMGAAEPLPEGDPRIKTREAVRRTKAALQAAYQDVARARNRAVAEGLTPSGDPLPPK